MKPSSTTYIALLLGQQNQFAMAELYTFAALDGTLDYFTDLDVPITYGGNVFKANSLRIEGLKYKIGVGFRVDEQTVKISAYPGETLFGADFLSVAGEGLLDGTYVTRQRAVFASTGDANLDYLNTPIAVITLFVGRVSTIDKIGRTSVEVKLKSPMDILTIDMPRNTYQPGCQWSLFDSGCTLNRSDFITSWTVAAAGETFVTPTIPISPINGADGIAYWGLGRMIFTSGALNNLEFSVDTNDGTNFYLKLPFLTQPAPGDTFNMSPGCAKTGRGGACELKFSNLNNFRGFPAVPPIVLSV